MGVWISKRGLAINPIYNMPLDCDWHLRGHRRLGQDLTTGR